MANSLKQCIDAGVVVVLDSSYCRGDISERLFVCELGYGLVPFTFGSSITGYFLLEGEKANIDGNQIERIATEDEVSQAKQLKVG